MNKFVDDLNAAVKSVGDIPRVKFVPGLPIWVYQWLDRKHAKGAVHEPATLAAFLAISKRFECETIFDLGALFGYFSLICKDLFPRAAITAFDMHTAAFDQLVRNVPNSVRCVNAVVSDVSKKDTTIFISGMNIFEKPARGWDYLYDEPGATKARGSKGAGLAIVDFLTLDEYCATNKAPDLIKIDVEGYQTKAVLGAKQLIKHWRPIVVIELHDPPKLARLGTTNQETVQPFFDEGYEGYWCGNHRSPDATFETFDHISPDKDRLSLVVFIP